MLEHTYRGPKAIELQKWLRTQISTLEEAKSFILEWGHQHGQVLQGGPMKDTTGSVRWMSGHLSLALDEQKGDDIWSSFATKYGNELYYHWAGNFPE